MVKFRYNGKKGNMNGVYGYDFSDHKVVEVTDDLAIKKLTDNSHFDIVDGNEDADDTKLDGGKQHDETGTLISHGVFKLKEDDTPYSKPEKTFDTKEEAETFLSEQTDGKKRKIMTKAKKA